MKVIPMGKGFVAGKISFSFYDDKPGGYRSSAFTVSRDKLETLSPKLIDWKWTHCAQRQLHPNGSTIEQLFQVSATIDSRVKAILVIEKEGVFSRLFTCQFTE
jgi:hypothetical protein